ncbi:unnamed protein product, partial [Aphanomyces euteiches]
SCSATSTLKSRTSTRSVSSCRNWTRGRFRSTIKRAARAVEISTWRSSSKSPRVNSDLRSCQRARHPSSTSPRRAFNSTQRFVHPVPASSSCSNKLKLTCNKLN